MNLLQQERSAYLQLHKHNPIHWYPWGDAAFQAARESGKPMLLSIGYAACHWCHVMAEESFSQEDLAGVANRFYICVKVDREELPAVDTVYMNACQLLTGRGGWPLQILATPDGRPFFAFTYLPKDQLSALLVNVAMGWSQQREAYEQAARAITDQLVGHAQSIQPARPSALLWEHCYQQLAADFDPKWGGFSPAPKFPMPQQLLFLLEYHRYTGHRPALDMAEHTLRQMYLGGIFDHIGGGFCRYATDDAWAIPHFEKLLCDNALLLSCYTQAYARTGKGLYRTAAERTADYMLRELAAPGGGFFASQSADSDGVEGKYYGWTPEEVYQLLGENDGAVFCREYGITPDGNFNGMSIPNLLSAERPEQDSDLLRQLRAAAYRHRLKRGAPARDEKILTGWNSMAIGALAQAGRIFGREKYLDAALAGAEFLQDTMTRRDRLFHRWIGGQARFPGTLEDYAWYAWALLELAESGCGSHYLTAAREVTAATERLFSDRVLGGYYLCDDSDPHLPMRPKDFWDGAYPSGNSVLLYVLLKLLKTAPEPALKRQAMTQMAYLAGAAGSYPCPFALTAMMRFAGSLAAQPAGQ